ncbi:uncharacterized protein LOC129971668 [Argiope bruennichi]|uniref:DUF19 domain-containing protein n=1 Tax=Argiope bruennichi TaxID=94029 RepID=A0A8T0E181_ARGBR|nr:uncharacterized protein LOC129971668 [Argiope bruennichi]KAF8763230.1 hypothetical protein HNY73_021433 [Argiope bruennichi]
MWSKVIPTVFGILCLVVIIESKVAEPEDPDKYYKCFTYAECVSDGSAHKNILQCFKEQPLEKLYPIFHYVNQTLPMPFKYQTNDIFQAIKEYCNENGENRVKAFELTFNGIFMYQDMACDSSNMPKQCQSVEKILNCFFNLLDKLMGSNKCTLN